MIPKAIFFIIAVILTGCITIIEDAPIKSSQNQNETDLSDSQIKR